MFVKKFLYPSFIVLSLVLGILAIGIVKIDATFTWRWPAFGFHIFSFLVIVFLFLWKLGSKKLHKIFHDKEILVFGGVVLLAILLSFFQLILYPYASLGDEVRDSGLYAQQIAQGQTKNIFDYGAYDGYGLIISTIASLFYNIFGSSVLTYRFPAALVSVLDITFLYILLRQITNKKISAIGAGILAVLPMHLFFARTQLVVAFNSLWTTLMLFAIYVLFETNSLLSYIFFGSVIGFASQFHATTRVVAILLLLLTICLKGFALLRKKIKFWTTLLGFCLLSIFAVISFGPQLLFTTEQSFFHTERFVLQKNLQSNEPPSGSQLASLGQNYIVSLGSWVVSPVGGDFFQDAQPLVPFFLLPLFFVGIGYSVTFVRKAFIYILFVLLFLIPFFSSAITDAVNNDHRMNSTLPFVAIFCSIGIYVGLRLLKKKFLKWIFLLLVSIYLIFLGITFFTDQVADYGRDVHQYVSMDVIYAIQNEIALGDNTKTYCLMVSSNDFVNYNYLHYKEQYQYFLPQVTVEKQLNLLLQDNEAYLYKGECDDSQKQTRFEEDITCGNTVNFMCPRNWSGKIRLYSD